MGGLVKAKSITSSGVGEIRTHEGLSPLAVFKTAAFNHSATTPRRIENSHRAVTYATLLKHFPQPTIRPALRSP